MGAHTWAPGTQNHDWNSACIRRSLPLPETEACTQRGPYTDGALQPPLTGVHRAGRSGPPSQSRRFKASHLTEQAGGHDLLATKVTKRLSVPRSKHPPPSRPASQDGSPGATNLPLVLGEQLGTAEEVLIPGEGDHGLRELPQVELQQGGHRVHVCCAVGRGTCMRPGTPGNPRSGQHLGPLPQGQPLLSHPHVCSRVHS